MKRVMKWICVLALINVMPVNAEENEEEEQTPVPPITEHNPYARSASEGKVPYTPHTSIGKAAYGVKIVSFSTRMKDCMKHE